MTVATNTGDTAGQDADTGEDWTSIASFAGKVGGTFASCVLDASLLSDWLWCSGLDLSVIPAGSTIDGILLQARVSATHNTWITGEVRLRAADGTLYASDGLTTFTWPSFAVTISRGGVGDTWSGITLEEIRDDDFSVAIFAECDIAATAPKTAKAYWCEMTIQYTEPPGAGGAEGNAYFRWEMTNG